LWPALFTVLLIVARLTKSIETIGMNVNLIRTANFYLNTTTTCKNNSLSSHLALFQRDLTDHGRENLYNTQLVRPHSPGNKIIATSIHRQASQWKQLENWFADSPQEISSEQVRNAIDQKTKPPGSLGQIEILAAQLALLQGSLTPSLEQGRIVVFGADHGVADEGVSAFPTDVTTQMMTNFANGGAAVCALGSVTSMDIEVVDVGVNNDLGHLPSIVHAKVAQGTSNFSKAPAMTVAQRDAAVDAGRLSITRALANNKQCVGLGEMGIANTSSASAIIALLLNVSAQRVTGRGTGIDDTALAHKAQVIQSAIDMHKPHATDAMSVLRHVGGFEIAAMVGAILEACQNQLPVLVDGFISSAAALIAVRHEPQVRRCLIFSHESAESGHGAVLEALNATPILKLNMRLGEGSATALAFPILQAAVAMMTKMSTFADAGVSEKST